MSDILITYLIPVDDPRGPLGIRIPLNARTDELKGLVADSMAAMGHDLTDERWAATVIDVSVEDSDSAD